MRILKSLALLAAIVPAPAVLAHGNEHEDAHEIQISMGEMYFKVEGQAQGEPLRLEVGERYELVFVNEGAMLHEVLLGRDVVEEQGIPSGYQEHLLREIEVGMEVEIEAEGASRALEVEAFGLEELELDPAVSVAVSFELPADRKGSWELGCFVPGHYEAGMKLPIIVE